MASFYVSAHLFIPHSRPISLSITFNLLDTTAAFCSDLWYVLRSSTNNRCVIFWLGAWDKLYPSVLLKYHAMGFSARVNNVTQKESPCKIPLFTLIGPIFSLSSLVFTSSSCDSPSLHDRFNEVYQATMYPMHFQCSYYPLVGYRVKRFPHVHPTAG